MVKKLRSLFISDENYLKKRFSKKLGYTPNFNRPKTLNEKITARMIYDRNPIYTRLADKLAVREVVSTKIGAEYLPSLIGIYQSVPEINFSDLPTKFVIKCTHDSGSSIICHDKNIFDIKFAKEKIKKCLKMNMYYTKREWHYKNIIPFIIIEEYIDLYYDEKSKSKITTCRVHCFENKPHYVEVDILGSDGIEYSNIYDTSWKIQPFTVDLKLNSKILIDMPEKFNLMIKLSEIICFKYGYSRIDFLITKDRVFFSEITLTPNAGRMIISPREWDLKLGNLWITF